jgi:hypothetical protein
LLLLSRWRWGSFSIRWCFDVFRKPDVCRSIDHGNAIRMTGILLLAADGFAMSQILDPVQDCATNRS